jgi:hypothetical protein
MGIFPGTVLFSMGYKPLELAKILKELYGEKDDWTIALSDQIERLDSTTAWYALRRDMEITSTGEKRIFFYILIPDVFDFSDYDYIRLAHEVLHICQYHLPDLLNRNEEREAEAYLHTHLMTQAMKLIRKAATTKTF